MPPTAVIDALDDEAALASRTERLLAACRRARQPLAVLRIGVRPPEGGEGDAASLRTEAAHRVRARLRATDPVFTVGTGEVAVVLVGVDEDTLCDIVARLYRGLIDPYRLGHALVSGARVRIGQAVCPVDGQTGVALVRSAGRLARS